MADGSLQVAKSSPHASISSRGALSVSGTLGFYLLTQRQYIDDRGPKTLEKGIVLIVEDEALIRMDAVQIVEDAGFAVVEAYNADEAIKILESRRDIRAVFTDINMPGSINGLQLAHAIRGRWPSIHLIVTSGLNVPNETQLPANSRFIGKPYTARHVATALNELFGPHLGPRRTYDGSGSRSKVA